ISIHMARRSGRVPQPQRPIELLVLAKPQQAARSADRAEEQPEPQGVDEVHRIHQHEELDLLALCTKLSCHFIGQQAAVAPTAKEVWALWLNCAHGPHMIRSDLLKLRRDLQPFEAIWVHRVEGLVWPEGPRQGIAEARQVLELAM